MNKHCGSRRVRTIAMLELIAPSRFTYRIDVQEFTIDWPLFNGRIEKHRQSQQKTANRTCDDQPNVCGITPRCEESQTEYKGAKRAARRADPTISAHVRFFVSQCTNEPAHHLCSVTVGFGHEL
jgi:hypothetical protein